jgi:alkylresorcinol/alkylpyrone synthase
MFIEGLGTATPENCFSQKQCWETLEPSQHYARLNPRAQALARKVLRGNNGIETRYLALDSLEQAFEMNPDALQARFAAHAPSVATLAAERALDTARRSTGDIDAILVSTCTGYLCPGLTSYISERLGLRPNVLALDLVGQGCGAAIPNLRVAEALLASQRCERVLSICVEICSAAFYLDDDPGVLISACLFGDGAGAAVLSREPKPAHRPVRWRFATTMLVPEDRDYLRFQHKDGMLRNILTPQVPRLAAKHADAVLKEAMSRAGFARSEIQAWIMHAGGREVLSAMSERLMLTEEDLRWSAAILRQYGNVSSPCVLFVLQSALAGGMPPGLWWMSSFGAGFSCHGALLEVG